MGNLETKFSIRQNRFFDRHTFFYFSVTSQSCEVMKSVMKSVMLKQARRCGFQMDIYQESLKYHAAHPHGKFSVEPTKPMDTQHDLSLAYSPGVAQPCLEIAKDPSTAYDYTNRGNLVAVISNGTAVLGLGNIGALASKPVMEGKAVLFKKFAKVNAIDIEVDTKDPDELIRTVKLLEPSFGGVNLEDIKGPDCFHVEEECKRLMKIPVFHDDQHGTAIICLAGIINVMKMKKMNIKDANIVMVGAGAAGIACMEMVKNYGADPKKCIMLDTRGVIYKGRTEGMNKYKERHACDTPHRNLEEAIKGADVFIGVSSRDLVTNEMLLSMNHDPVIFAMANPHPEITPDRALSVRSDSIVATGRSDYPNQINNVMCFPFLFRGALDVRATEINEPMKIAVAYALADLAREPVPDVVRTSYPPEKDFTFGPHYLVPTPFDPRLLKTVSMAAAKAACDSGVATRPITDWNAYLKQLDEL